MRGIGIAAMVLLVGIHLIASPVFVTVVSDHPHQAGQVSDFLYLVGDLPEGLTEREVAHMHDVRRLFMWTHSILSIIVVVIIILLIQNPVMRGGELRVAGAILAFPAVLLLISLPFFDAAFRLFHEVVFTNDLWLLPPGSLLLEWFPESYFIATAAALLFYTALASALLIIAGIRYGDRIREGQQQARDDFQRQRR